MNDLKTLSLKELHETLKLRGLTLSYSALSEFVGTGDIAEQLGVSGGGNRKQFLPDVADILIAFWPIFREAGGRKPNAPALLRRFLASSSPVSGSQELSVSGAMAKFAVPETEELTVLKRIEAHLTCQPRADRLLKAEHACKLLACSESTLRKRIRPVLRGRWRWSDLMLFIAALAPEGKEGRGDQCV